MGRVGRECKKEMQRGLFISFEGTEGCGKSTQIRELEGQLASAGRKAIVTREPGGTVVGEEIRRLLQFTPEAENMVSEAELLLFAASRAQLVREVIEPALAEGAVVIADRFLDSTTVYQGIARGLGVEPVQRINAFAVADRMPELTVLLDIDSAEGHARAIGSTASEGGADRMEIQPPSFYEAVRQGYLDLAAIETDRFLVIDAARGVEEIAEEIWKAIEERLAD